MSRVNSSVQRYSVCPKYGLIEFFNYVFLSCLLLHIDILGILFHMGCVNGWIMIYIQIRKQNFFHVIRVQTVSVRTPIV